MGTRRGRAACWRATSRAGRRPQGALSRLPELGHGVADAADLPELARRLSPRAAWALAGVHDADGLWIAEARWWRRVEDDARALLARGSDGMSVADRGRRARRGRCAPRERRARGGRSRGVGVGAGGARCRCLTRRCPCACGASPSSRPRAALRDALVALADDGGVELSGELPALVGPQVDALRRLEREPGTRAESRVSVARAPDLDAPERAGDWSTLAGEAELARRAGAAIHHGPVAAVVGLDERGRASRRCAAGSRPLGAALVELESPRWIDPPTLLRPLRAGSAFRPLVDIYGAARYADIDPTPFAAVTFVLMFGMMFGDVGHGLMLVAARAAACAARGAPRSRATARSGRCPAAAGAAAAAFGLLYGEAFGPTGLVPTLWMAPLDDPVAAARGGDRRSARSCSR